MVGRHDGNAVTNLIYLRRLLVSMLQGHRVNPLSQSGLGIGLTIRKVAAQIPEEVLLPADSPPK